MGGLVGHSRILRRGARNLRSAPYERPSPLPDLAVEVRSPSTWRHDTGAKKAAYERRGLRELWVVDTAAEGVLVFRRSRPGSHSFDVALELRRGRILESPLLPGFGLAVDELFGGATPCRMF